MDIVLRMLLHPRMVTRGVIAHVVQDEADTLLREAGAERTESLAAAERRLNPPRTAPLTDIQVTKSTAQPQPIKLPRLFLKTADQQHFAVEFLQLFWRRVIRNGIARLLTVGRGGRGRCSLFRRGGSARRSFGQGRFLCS